MEKLMQRVLIVKRKFKGEKMLDTDMQVVTDAATYLCIRGETLSACIYKERSGRSSNIRVCTSKGDVGETKRCGAIGYEAR